MTRSVAVSEIGERLEGALDNLAAYPRADEPEYRPRTEFDHVEGG